MKVKIFRDEFYPFYIKSTFNSYDEYDIDKKIWYEYLRAQKLFNKAWNKLNKEIHK